MDVHLQPNSKINSHGFLMLFHQVIVLKGEKELIQQVWTSMVCVLCYDSVPYLHVSFKYEIMVNI
jgi:hypothetical protein